MSSQREPVLKMPMKEVSLRDASVRLTVLAKYGRNAELTTLTKVKPTAALFVYLE